MLYMSNKFTGTVEMSVVDDGKFVSVFNVMCFGGGK